MGHCERCGDEDILDELGECTRCADFLSDLYPDDDVIFDPIFDLKDGWHGRHYEDDDE